MLWYLCVRLLHTTTISGQMTVLTLTLLTVFGWVTGVSSWREKDHRKNWKIEQCIINLGFYPRVSQALPTTHQNSPEMTPQCRTKSTVINALTLDLPARKKKRIQKKITKSLLCKPVIASTCVTNACLYVSLLTYLHSREACALS